MDPVLPAHLPHQRPGQQPGLTARAAALLVALVGALLLLAAPAFAATSPQPVLAAAPGHAFPGIPAPLRDASLTAPTPVAPVRPAGATPAPSLTPGPGGSLDVRDGKGGLTQPVSLVLLLGGLSLVPGMLIMITAFTRIVIVMGLTRSAIGTQGTPPNQVLIGLSLFLTLFVMGPAISKANHDAVQPYLNNEISQSVAFEKGIAPFRDFMMNQVREQDLTLFVELSGKDAPKDESDIPLTTLIPAYVISELRAAFLIGFIIFIPFLVIDLVVSAALSAMGMAMLPPSLVSLPFKLLLFVAVDGWYLLVQSLVQSFHMTP
ncbi:MAG: flagellar biosynthetic protein FliP [Frankiales bacterium]|nr:flagellar biosynthetic protein FliP [Frankiales bacterium]